MIEHARPRLACLAIAALGAIAPAWAQEPAQPPAARPYRGLFGGGSSASTQSFDASLALSGAYDRNPPGDGGALMETPAPGWQTMALATLAYGWRTPRVQVSANVAGTARTDTAEVRDVAAGSQTAAAGMALTLGKTRLTANHLVSYSPSYFYGPTPAAGISPAGAFSAPVDLEMPAAYSVGDVNSYSHALSVGLAQEIGGGLSVQVSGVGQQVRFGSAPRAQRMLSYTGALRYRRPVTRNAAWRIGYAYRGEQYDARASNDPVVAHDIDLGMDYGRALSISRRTRIRFASGSTLLSVPDDGASGQQLQYTATGRFELTHEVGRTWNARAGYNRGVGFRRGFSGPVFSDDVTVGVTGLITRRLDVSIAGAYSTGSVGIAREDNGLESYTGSAQLRFALSRFLAGFAEYTRSSYRLDAAAVLPGVTPAFDNSGVRIGVSLLAPVWRN